MLRVSMVLGLALSVGCAGSDDILERADELDQGGGGSPGAGPAPGTASPPQPGSPDAPSPGAPGQPQAGTAPDPPPGDPNVPPPGGKPGGQGEPGGAIDGPAVTLSGTISVPGWESGEIRIDVFDGDQQDLTGPRPGVVGFGKLDKPGAFSVQVPASTPKVWLGAFHDADGDGRPGPQDPSGWLTGNPVHTDGTVSGLDLELVARPPPGGEMQ